MRNKQCKRCKMMINEDQETYDKGVCEDCYWDAMAEEYEARREIYHG